MIKIEKVTKKFAEKVAVDDLSLTVERGEIFAFLGPNGAGKTTTIKMMVGLLRPTSGRISLGGHDVIADYVEAKRMVGYIPDEPYLYDKLSGREFLEFVARIFQLEPEKARRSAAQLIEKFSMGDYIESLTEEYSHGMKQRLVIASCLLHEPQIIIVDEPMVGLDPASTRLVKDVFRERSRAGVTIFMSTHTLPVAEELAGRIGIILNGSLRALGSRGEISALAASPGTFEDAFLKLTSE